MIEREREQLDLVRVGHGAARRRGDFVNRGRLHRPPLDLLNDDETFSAVDIEREGRRRAAPQGRMRRVHDRFDVLRIQIPTANDDEIFASAGDEQLSIAEEAQISGPQIRPLVIGKPCLERVGRRLGVPPVALAHGRPRYPDFAHA